MTFTLTVPGTDDRLRRDGNQLVHADQRFEIIEHGIHDLVTESARSGLDTFATDYAAVRAAEGRALDADGVRRLPDIDPDHPLAAMWTHRRTSFLRFCDHLPAHPGTVLDIGAGSGWLSARLSERGWSAAALDVTISGGDGLETARHHKADLLLVRGDMGLLPFASNTIDLAVFNASLHYAANVPAALHEAARVIRPGGQLVVLDSPVFTDRAAGQQMVADFDAAVSERHGLTAAAHQGPGFVTWDQLTPFGLDEANPTHALKARFHRWRGARRAGRETAQRPLLLAHVTSSEPATITTAAQTAHPGAHQ